MNRVKHGEDVGGAAAGNEPEAAEIAHSAIVILVPEADPLVAAYRERYDPAAARSGPVPVLFEPLHRWLGVLFFLYMVLAYLATAAYGGALLQTAALPGWAVYLMTRKGEEG